MNIPTNKSEWPSGHFSNDLRLMAATITELELWDWFMEENPPEGKGYSWWEHPNISKISDNLKDGKPVRKERGRQIFNIKKRNKKYNQRYKNRYISRG